MTVKATAGARGARLSDPAPADEAWVRGQIFLQHGHNIRPAVDHPRVSYSFGLRVRQ